MTWELARDTVGSDFFAARTVSELAGWTDYDLENAGRLAEPMCYDAATDKYVPITWEDAFELAGATLRGLASRNEAAFYTSGRLSNEATFLYQLWAREFGTNNLPDCSNMCHEASGRALMLATIRSHDQFNTTIYSNDDRYRGLKGLRTVVFMNEFDMGDRGLEEFDLIDITSFSKDGSQRSVYGYRAVSHDIPRGCAAG